MSEHQIRGDIDDNSKKIFLNSQSVKPYIVRGHSMFLWSNKENYR